jgi:periplasmic protein TonB
MSRLLLSFCLAFAGHIVLLQFHLSVNKPSPPQLISDSSVSVTLEQRQEKQPVKETEPLSQPEHKEEPVVESKNADEPIPEPAPKLVPEVIQPPREPISILPQKYKNKKETKPLPVAEKVYEAPVKQEESLPRNSAKPIPLSASVADNDEKLEEAVSKDLTSSVIEARPLYQHNPKPEYPKIARRRGWEGIVMLEVAVNEKGETTSVQLHKSCGHKILDKSALRAVKNWKFLAGTANGKPTLTIVMIPIHFTLNK